MTRHRLAVIPGDGIGPEVVDQGVRVLERVAELGYCEFEMEAFPWGGGYYLEHGIPAPPEQLDIVRGYDAVFYGAVGLPGIAPERFTRVLLPMRQGLGLYVNLRPLRLYPGIKSPLHSPGEIDFDIVRENSEGEYVDIGGGVHRTTSDEIAVQTSVITRRATERIMRYSFELARQRGRRKHVWCVTKSNALGHLFPLWDDIFDEVAAEYPDISTTKTLVDAMTMVFINRPHELDVVVASNLMGDILSDEGAAITGSIGLAASGNINPQRDTPSVFEPCHGSAPDIAGKGIANPIAQIGAGAMMLDWLGETEAAAAVQRAIERTLADRASLTPDLGGTASTAQLTDALLARLDGPSS